MIFDAFRQPLSESLTQDFGVADDGADLAESLLAGLLHLHMGVGQHLGQLGHDAGQAGGKLFGCTEGHGTKQLHRAWMIKGKRDKTLPSYTEL